MCRAEPLMTAVSDPSDPTQEESQVIIQNLQQALGLAEGKAEMGEKSCGNNHYTPED